MITVTLGGASAHAARLALAAARIAERAVPPATLAGARDRAGVKGSLARAKQRFEPDGGDAEAMTAEIVRELEA